jgi:pimeloyl-ACP methyl ester carboxylesterase
VRSAVSLSGCRALTNPVGGDPPILDFHGDADPLVPYQSAVDTVNAATAVGDTAYLTTFPGAGHVPYLQNRQTILDQTTNFLYWTMDLIHEL